LVEERCVDITCRHQIRDGAGRDALHVARVLAMSLAAADRKADTSR
jgi:hypothetical protein